MQPKNTICLWFDKDALEAARFYAATFPDSAVMAVTRIQAQRGLLLSDCDGQPSRDRPVLERHRRQRRPGKSMRVV